MIGTVTADPQTLLRVEHLLSTSRYPEAESTLRTLLASDPESASLFRMLSKAMTGQDRHLEAVVAARRACHLAPDDHANLVTLSSSAISAGQVQLAVSVAHDAVLAEPNAWTTHYTLGRALLAQGEWSEALRAANQAGRLAPASADVHNLIGLCLTRLGPRREAREEFRRALQLDPHHALALNNLAAMDLRWNSLRAVRGLAAAAGADPQRQLIHLNLAVVTHNLVFQLRWAVIGGGLLEIVLAYGAAPRGLRLTLLMVIATLVLAAVWNFARSLPRGVRRSPLRLLAGFRGRTALGIVYLLFAGLVTVAVALGTDATRDWGARWLAQMAVIGLVLVALRSGSRSRKHR